MSDAREAERGSGERGRAALRSTRTWPLFVALLVGATVVGAAGPAFATTCLQHTGERMQVELVGVYIGRRQVEPPPELGRLDEVMTGWRATEVTLDSSAPSDLPPRFVLEATYTPPPIVAQYLRETARRLSSGPCESHYAPLLPGRYVGRRDADEEDPLRVPGTPAGTSPAGDTVLIIAPGRDRVELRFRLHERSYRAVYEVTCAYFLDDHDDPRLCGVNVATRHLGVARRVDRDERYLTILERLAGARYPDQPTPSAARCAVTSATGPLLALVLLLLRRRRSGGSRR